MLGVAAARPWACACFFSLFLSFYSGCVCPDVHVYLYVRVRVCVTLGILLLQACERFKILCATACKRRIQCKGYSFTHNTSDIRVIVIAQGGRREKEQRIYTSHWDNNKIAGCLILWYSDEYIKAETK